MVASYEGQPTQGIRSARQSSHCLALHSRYTLLSVCQPTSQAFVPKLSFRCQIHRESWQCRLLSPETCYQKCAVREAAATWHPAFLRTACQFALAISASL